MMLGTLAERRRVTLVLGTAASHTQESEHEERLHDDGCSKRVLDEEQGGRQRRGRGRRKRRRGGGRSRREDESDSRDSDDTAVTAPSPSPNTRTTASVQSMTVDDSMAPMLTSTPAP